MDQLSVIHINYFALLRKLSAAIAAKPDAVHRVQVTPQVPTGPPWTAQKQMKIGEFWKDQEGGDLK